MKGRGRSDFAGFFAVHLFALYQRTSLQGKG